MKLWNFQKYTTRERGDGDETCYFRIVNQILLRCSSFWLLRIFLPLIRLLTVFLQFCGSRERAVIRLHYRYTHSMHVLFYYYLNLFFLRGRTAKKSKKKKRGQWEKPHIHIVTYELVILFCCDHTHCRN